MAKAKTQEIEDKDRVEPVSKEKEELEFISKDMVKPKIEDGGRPVPDVEDKDKVEPKYTPARKKVPMVAILVLNGDGSITVLDGKDTFKDDVEKPLDTATLQNMVQTVAKNMEKAALIEEVKRALAQTFLNTK